MEFADKILKQLWARHGFRMECVNSVIHFLSYAIPVYTNANGCTVSSSTVFNVTVNPLPAQASYNLYPQPSDGHFTVSIVNPENETFSIEVYNMYGSKVYEVRNLKLNGGRLDQQIELPPLANGFYSVVLNSGKDKVYRRIVVQK